MNRPERAHAGLLVDLEEVDVAIGALDGADLRLGRRSDGSIRSQCESTLVLGTHDWRRASKLAIECALGILDDVALLLGLSAKRG